MRQPCARVRGGRTAFRVRSPLAEALHLCLFDEDGEARLPMHRDGEDWVLEVPRDLSGTSYGYRAEGIWSPEEGRWFDPAKLLVDPYALELDRRFVQTPEFAKYAADTAEIVPRAVVPGALAEVSRQAPHFAHGSLVYELNVATFTALHSDVPEPAKAIFTAASCVCAGWTMPPMPMLTMAR